MGHDTGGLKREFFRLFSRAVFETYMTPTGCNSVALQVKLLVLLFDVVLIFSRRILFLGNLVS